MQLLLVRHGQSVLNAQHKHQFPETPLSELGRQQAQAIANRLSHFPVDTVYTSSYARAFETAKTIADQLKVPVVELPDLHEWKRPTQVQGKSNSDPIVQKFHQQLDLHDHDPDWHFSDEENFTDFKARALRVERFFANLAMETNGPEQVVAVSHGIVLGLILAVMAFGPDLTSQEFSKWIKFIHHSNTGLTWCEFSQDRWQMHTWNDQAHLG